MGNRLLNSRVIIDREWSDLERAGNTLKSLLLLIHYWFPVAVGWSVVLVIHRATRLPILTSGLHLYLLGIWAAYSFDRIADNAEQSRPLWLTTALALGFVLSTIAAFFLVIHLSVKTFSALLLFSAITLLYIRAKKLPFVKGALVSIVWGWAGVALPFANHHWFAWQFWTMQISLPLVILMTCNVILCDFKDMKSDHLNCVKSLPAMLGPRRTIMIVSILLVTVAIISYEENLKGLLISGAALFLLAQFPRLLSLDAIGPLIVDASLTVPGLLIALHLIS